MTNEIPLSKKLAIIRLVKKSHLLLSVRRPFELRANLRMRE